MTPEEYNKQYKDSLQDPDKYWGQVARQLLTWTRPFTKVYEPGKENPFDGFTWFSDGTLNACYNAVDRHAISSPNKLALIWEPTDPGTTATRSYTYSELLVEVKRVAAYLKQEAGVCKGDRVCLYMPTCPEALFVMLACARIGAVHNVVFAALGWEALLARIQDSHSRVVFVANGCRVKDKTVRLYDILDEALKSDNCVERVVIVNHCNNVECVIDKERDVWWNETIQLQDTIGIECEEMNAEDPLYFLYTSGSTGKPKAMVHTTAGYLTFAAYTFKCVFDVVNGDEACLFITSDIGWVSAHSYGLYGPLVNGATVIWVEGACHYPTADRPWKIINRHSATHFYTSPTVLRALKRHGDDFVHECPTLKLLGCAGEPLDPPTWAWYHDVVGRAKCPIVDTYWQTETGGVLIGTIPGASTSVPPGYAGLPFMGIEPDIIPFQEQHEGGALVIKRPWPGLARTIHNNHQRYRETYLQQHHGAYYCGDGASQSATGAYRIHGRIDDTINVGPVRFATAEIEGTLTKHPYCSEAAVLGVPDQTTGEAVIAFCTLATGCAPSDQLTEELRRLVGGAVCEMAAPRCIYYTSDLPKTRSGKIMRRVLRKIVHGSDDLGDLSTLVNPEIVSELQSIVTKAALMQ